MQDGSAALAAPAFVAAHARWLGAAAPVLARASGARCATRARPRKRVLARILARERGAAPTAGGTGWAACARCASTRIACPSWRYDDLDAGRATRLRTAAAGRADRGAGDRAGDGPRAARGARKPCRTRPVPAGRVPAGAAALDGRPLPARPVADAGRRVLVGEPDGGGARDDGGRAPDRLRGRRRSTSVRWRPALARVLLAPPGLARIAGPRGLPLRHPALPARGRGPAPRVRLAPELLRAPRRRAMPRARRTSHRRRASAARSVCPPPVPDRSCAPRSARRLRPRPARARAPPAGSLARDGGLRPDAVWPHLARGELLGGRRRRALRGRAGAPPSRRLAYSPRGSSPPRAWCRSRGARARAPCSPSPPTCSSSWRRGRADARPRLARRAGAGRHLFGAAHHRRRPLPLCAGRPRARGGPHGRHAARRVRRPRASRGGPLRREAPRGARARGGGGRARETGVAPAFALVGARRPGAPPTYALFVECAGLPAAALEARGRAASSGGLSGRATLRVLPPARPARPVARLSRPRRRDTRLPGAAAPAKASARAPSSRRAARRADGLERALRGRLRWRHAGATMRVVFEAAAAEHDAALRRLMADQRRWRARSRSPSSASPATSPASDVQAPFHQVVVGRDAATGELVGVGTRAVRRGLRQRRLRRTSATWPTCGSTRATAAGRCGPRLPPPGRAAPRRPRAPLLHDDRGGQPASPWPPSPPDAPACPRTATSAASSRRPSTCAAEQAPVRSDGEVVRGRPGAAGRDRGLPEPQPGAAPARSRLRRGRLRQPLAARLPAWRTSTWPSAAAGWWASWAPGTSAAFKQTVVRGYGPRLAVARPFYNAAARARRAGRVIRAPGESLRSFYASFVAVDDDELAVFRALLRALYNDHVGGGHHYFVLGLHERDPLVPRWRTTPSRRSRDGCSRSTSRTARSPGGARRPGAVRRAGHAVSTLRRAAVPLPALAAARVARRARPGSLPRWGDPRIAFAGLLTLYAVLGVTVLRFGRDPLQMLLTVAAACALDMALAWWLRGERLVPLSRLHLRPARWRCCSTTRTTTCCCSCRCSSPSAPSTCSPSGAGTSSTRRCSAWRCRCSSAAT